MPLQNRPAPQVVRASDAAHSRAIARLSEAQWVKLGYADHILAAEHPLYTAVWWAYQTASQRLDIIYRARPTPKITADEMASREVR